MKHFEQKLIDMQLEEEKKLVANFMNYIIIDRLHMKYGDGPYKGQYFKDGSPWEPWEDRNAWPEIWKKFTPKMWESYFNYIIMHFREPHNYNEASMAPEHQLTHIAPASVCWEALIKTLEETP